MTQPFVHLHTHSEYSFVDGSLRIPAMVEAAKKMGHSHIALTDHANMHGAIEFYFKAREAGITPILGCEIYLKSLLSGEPAHQLVLLAQNTKGYKNLIKIVSQGYLGENFSSGMPIVDYEYLRGHGSHLVGISSFHRGEFSTLAKQVQLANPNLDELNPEHPHLSFLTSYREAMQSCFGKENFFIEITDNDLPHQKQDIKTCAKIASLLALPLVASANAHYLQKDFADTHALAVAMKNSLTLKEIDKRLRNVHFHLMDNAEMSVRFAEYPEALSNTLIIAERCSGVKIETGQYYFPKISQAHDEPTTITIRRLSEEGLRARLESLKPLYGEEFTEEKQKIYWDRLNYELEVILKTGFVDYFLIVQDFIRWSKSKGIPVGPGRGSGAGSLVAYSLTITDLDPLKYDLIFERFLNPERISMPDFDIDFCQWRREEVINYCIEKYGKNNVAQITTFGKMNAKGVVKGVGRAKGLGFNRVDQFTKLFPNDLGLTLQMALDQEPRIKEEMAKDEELRECMDQALKLEGLCSHTSVHAAGIVMSDGDMTNYIPIYTTDGSSYITQYEMKLTEKVGLVKFDFLGLKTLTVIDKAISWIRKQGTPDFDINKIRLDERRVFQMISEGHTVGVFQCESSGITQLIKKLKPSSFDDMIALVALYRPGPLGSGMVDDFVRNKHGQQKITYLLSELEPILKETYGMILYQDQVLRIAAVLARYTLGEADLLRKAMGKKIPEEMAKQKARFVSGSKDNGIPEDKAEEIFELMAEFAKYGFNKAHSAAYGLISYQTAYLKTFYPEAYLAACMTCDMDNTDKLVKYAEDCKRLNIKLLTPNINRSFLEFYPQKGQIDFALCAIKGLGENSIKPLLEEREQNGRFISLTDLAKRVHLGKFGKKNLQLLIAAGALDEFPYKRKTLDELVPQLVDYSTALHEAHSSGQRGLFDLDSNIQSKAQENWIHQSQFPQLKSGESSWNLEDLFQEKRLMGTFLTKHPLNLFHFDNKAFSSVKIADFEKIVSQSNGIKTKISLYALLTKIEYRRSKKGSLLAYVRLEQVDSFHEGMMFSSALEGVKLPDINTLVIADGSLEKMNPEMPLRFNIEKLTDVQELRKNKIRSLNLHFHMNGKNKSEEEILVLKNLMQKFPGQTSIKFFMKYEKVSLKIDTPQWQINPCNDFLSQIAQLPSLNIDLLS